MSRLEKSYARELGHEKWQAAFLAREQHIGSRNVNTWSLAGPWSVRRGEAKGDVDRAQSSLELVSPQDRGSKVFWKGRRWG